MYFRKKHVHLGKNLIIPVPQSPLPEASHSPRKERKRNHTFSHLSPLREAVAFHFLVTGPRERKQVTPKVSFHQCKLGAGGRVITTEVFMWGEVTSPIHF